MQKKHTCTSNLVHRKLSQENLARGHSPFFPQPSKLVLLISTLPMESSACVLLKQLLERMTCFFVWIRKDCILNQRAVSREMPALNGDLFLNFSVTYEGTLSLSRECECHAPIWLAKQLQVSRGDSKEREEIQVGSQPAKCLRHFFQSNPWGVIGSDPAVPKEWLLSIRNDSRATSITTQGLWNTSISTSAQT